MLVANHFKLLRLPFSFFLLPVFVFALSEAGLNPYNPAEAIGLFLIIHLLVYPSSNAYNSYIDQDEGPIGGLEHPPKADRMVFYLSLVMDGLACLLGLWYGVECAIYLLLYILASRAYSSRQIRLKKYPIAGFLTVVVFQGGFMFLLCYRVLTSTWPGPIPVLISSLLIGAVYPLTQIYQHEADRKDGVKTISLLLGYKGTFILTACMFSAATLLFYFHHLPNLFPFWLLQAFMFPVLCYFAYWFYKVNHNIRFADFKHTMRMNILASTMLNLYFITLLFIS